MTNQYEIGEEIFDHAIVLGRFGGEGKSGFGVVYLVAEKNTGLALAVKTLQKENISITDLMNLKMKYSNGLICHIIHTLLKHFL